MFSRQILNASRQSFAASRQGFQNVKRQYATQRTTGDYLLNATYIAGGGALAAAGYYYFKGKPSMLITPLPPAKDTLKGDNEWVDLKLVHIEPYNHNTQKFRFALPDKNDVSGLHTASALLTKYKGPDDKKPTIRPYTPISGEEERGYLDLLVKKYPNGPMSNHIHDMEVNQELAFKGPIPKYPWEANKHDHIALIAGATGITPMYQLARNIFKNRDDKTKVTLVFANVTEEDILLRKEWYQLENAYPQRFKAYYVLDKPNKEWTGTEGQINKDLLKTVLPEPKSENIKIFVCGPPGMMKAISGDKKSPKDQGELTGQLSELGYTAEQVYKF